MSIRTRKPHTCYWCGYGIRKGATCETAAWIDPEYGRQRIWAHLVCDAVANRPHSDGRSYADDCRETESHDEGEFCLYELGLPLIDLEQVP
jgi:hypothetical protein